MSAIPQSFDLVRKGYSNLWRTAKVRPERRSYVEGLVNRYFNNVAKYDEVQKATGVPSWWVFCVHVRESGGDFAGVLHNGQKIIGTGRQTTIAPKRRGPFSSWSQAAADAVKLKELQNVKTWDAPRCLYEFERFNGFGYFGKAVNSPYVWADTTLEERGKYVADGKFDKSFDDPQVGCAALLKILCEKRPAIDKVVNLGIPATEPVGAEKLEPQPLYDTRSFWVIFVEKLLGQE